MKDYKNSIQPDQDPLTPLEVIGCCCFFLLMFLPFSREAWAVLLTFIKG